MEKCKRNEQSDIYDLTASVLRALRNSLAKYDFIEILPAILSERFEPGAKHSIAVMGNYDLPKVEREDCGDGLGIGVYGKHIYYLPVSHAVEKQIALEHAKRVYCLVPCVRLVMPGEEFSARHLYTFFQVEIEWRTESIDGVFSTAEGILFQFATSMLLLDGLSVEMRERLAALCARPYVRLTFMDAVERVRGNCGSGPVPDLTVSEEEDLCRRFKSPIWIYDYPEGVRDSLYRRNHRGLYDTYDLLLPFGHGEVSTGGLRPESSDEIIRQSNIVGKNLHLSYAEWKDRTKIQTAGFGIGLERLIRYVGCYESILDTRRFHDSGPNCLLQKNS